MSVPSLKYHRIPLPALGAELPGRMRQAIQLLHFPVATVCAALQLDLKTQRTKVNRDYSEYLSKLRLSTAGGPQSLCASDRRPGI
jgi:hypothetical protein